MATLRPISTTPLVPGPSTIQAGGSGFPLSSVALTHVTSTGPVTAAVLGWLPLESEVAVIVFESACALRLHANNNIAELIARTEKTFDNLAIMPPLLFKILTIATSLGAASVVSRVKHSREQHFSRR